MKNDRSRGLGLGIILLAALPMVAHAQDDEWNDDRWYLTPSLSFIKGDRGRDADIGYGTGIGLGAAVNRWLNLEVGFKYDTLTGDGGKDDFDQWSIGVDGLFFLNRNRLFSPYLVGGGGFLKTNFDGDKSTNPMVNLGVGFEHELTDHGTALRTDVRWRRDFDNDSLPDEDAFDDWVFNLGLSVPLGKQVAAAAADSDRDGVPDDRDDCPGTPLGAAVDERGCELDSDGDGVVDRLDRCPNTPPGAAVDANGCEFDSDGDGVVDSKDRCPGTREGTEVDEYGCELDSDSDGDGVADSKDLCPGTTAGVEVDAVGCPISEDIVLKGVNFKHGSAQLTEEALSILGPVAATLSQHPNVKVEVEGHTDSQGSADYNQGLSQRRAEAVVDYLTENGVDANNLSARGYGEEQSIADNSTPEGRTENRRVELKILE